MVVAVVALEQLDLLLAITLWALVALEPHRLLQDRQSQGLVEGVGEVLVMVQLLALLAVRAAVVMALKTSTQLLEQ
jgi:hypothetical protein